MNSRPILTLIKTPKTVNEKLWADQEFVDEQIFIEEPNTYSFLQGTREVAGLTLEDVALRIGITITELKNFEQGLKVKNHTLIENCFWEIIRGESNSQVIQKLNEEINKMRKEVITIELVVRNVLTEYFRQRLSNNTSGLVIVYTYNQNYSSGTGLAMTASLIAEPSNYFE